MKASARKMRCTLLGLVLSHKPGIAQTLTQPIEALGAMTQVLSIAISDPDTYRTSNLLTPNIDLSPRLF